MEFKEFIEEYSKKVNGGWIVIDGIQICLTDIDVMEEIVHGTANLGIKAKYHIPIKSIEKVESVDKTTWHIVITPFDDVDLDEFHKLIADKVTIYSGVVIVEKTELGVHLAIKHKKPFALMCMLQRLDYKNFESWCREC